jgi:guanyl-specific ribonuclease Sa
VRGVGADELAELNQQIDFVVQHHNRFGRPPAGIAQGSRKGAQRGIFDNVAAPGRQRLPEMPEGYYREVDVFPRQILKKGEVPAGARRVLSRDDLRLILGQNGEVYISFDHYTTFIRLR